MDETTTYRYNRFRMRHMLADVRFSRAALEPGDVFKPIELPTADAGTVRIGGPRDRPQVVVTGSLTCPLTESSTPLLRQLHAEHDGRIDLVLLSVREAHPGERLPQPTTAAAAEDRARHLASHHQVSFTVAIDTLDGEVHRRLDHKPNAVLVLGTDGRVAYRGLWAATIGPLRAAIEAVADGRAPERAQDRSILGPMTSALPSFPAVINRGGRQARRDLRRSAAPMAFAGRLAAALPLGRARHRSLAAMGILMIAMAALIAVPVLAVTGE